MHSGFPVLLNKAVWWVSEQGGRQITIASNRMRLITELGGETFLKNPSSQKIKMHWNWIYFHEDTSFGENRVGKELILHLLNFLVGLNQPVDP